MLETSAKDWQALLAYTEQFPRSYSYDSVPKDLADAERLFDDRDRSHLLSVKLGTVLANCHFFSHNEIEFDIDPREIDSPAAHILVLEFMEGLAAAIGKPVRLTPENGADRPCLSYDPTDCRWQIHPLLFPISQGG